MGNCIRNKSHNAAINIISWTGQPPVWRIYIAMSDETNTTTTEYKVEVGRLLIGIVSGYNWEINDATRMNIYVQSNMKPFLIIIGKTQPKYLNSNGEIISEERAETMLYNLFTGTIF